MYDYRGRIRYFLGAQIDVSGLAITYYGLQSLEKLVNNEDISPQATSDTKLAELAQLLDPIETQTVKDNHRELRIPRTWDSASAHDVGKGIISQF